MMWCTEILTVEKLPKSIVEGLIHTHTYIQYNTCIHTYIHTLIHTYLRFPAVLACYRWRQNCRKVLWRAWCTYVHTSTHPYIHTCMHTFIHTYIPVLFRSAHILWVKTFSGRWHPCCICLLCWIEAVCMYVCIYVCWYECMYAGMCACMYMKERSSLHVCALLWVYRCFIWTLLGCWNPCYTCLLCRIEAVCMYACMFCMHICWCVHVCRYLLHVCTFLWVYISFI
jgi:hypothetical protein